VPDANEVQIVPKGSGDVCRPSAIMGHKMGR
jgi:hypothetical protein